MTPLLETKEVVWTIRNVLTGDEKFNVKNDTRGTKNFEVIKQQGKELRGNEYRRELAKLRWQEVSED